MALGPSKVYLFLLSRVKCSAVSAPGKVLIAGGYLILDPKQIGLVIALSARICVVVEREDEPSISNLITVTSPQFTAAEWKYEVTSNSSDVIEIKDLYALSSFLTHISTPESPNSYIRLALSYALAYLSEYPNSGARITIYADNDYYSQSSSPTYEHLKSLPRFNKLNTPITKANKTGLGSSAALITALTAAILSSFSHTDVTTKHGKLIVHNVAQAAHCAAQGKVGSGFDVAAAVYGSCVYRRFVPEVLEQLWSDPNWTNHSERYDGACRRLLRETVDKAWDMDVTPFRLPAGLRVVMGDVAAGSATPGMVKSVLKWKASGSDAMKVWEDLGESNRTLIELFNQIKDSDASDIIDAIRRRSNDIGPSSDTKETLHKISQGFNVFLCIVSLTSRIFEDSYARWAITLPCRLSQNRKQHYWKRA